MARIRASRVGEQIRQEFSQILQQEMKDPRIGFVTVTKVEMSRDLQVAKVYLSIFGSADEKEVSLTGIEKAKGFIRTELGRRIQLRHVPELQFVIDESLEYSEQINKLLRDVQNERPTEDSTDETT